MLLQVHPSSISGQIQIPPSKSHSIRALLLAALAEGKSELKNVLNSEDVEAALQVLKDWGVDVKIKPLGDLHESLDIEVEGKGLPKLTLDQSFYTGQSGITTTFLLPLLALREGIVHVDADEQMRKRPFKELLQALRLLGATVEAAEGDHVPLSLSGPLRGRDLSVQGQNSQVVSALLLALPLAEGESTLRAEKLQERPYVSMTEIYLKKAGLYFIRQGDVWTIPGGQKPKTLHEIIPGDFSSASALMVAGVLKSELLQLQGRNPQDVQGDKVLMDLLKAMGADLTWEGSELIIRGQKPLNGMIIDAGDFPDLVPALTVAATQAKGETVLKNVAILRAKESDRLAALCEGLGKMGAHLSVQGEDLIIRPSVLKGATVPCYGDHRMAMAFAIAALCATGPTRLEGSECVAKTFPHFFDSLRHLGASIHSLT